MSISKIDPNLANLGVKDKDVKWLSAHDSLFSLHGVFYEEESCMEVSRFLALQINFGGR